MHLEKLMPAYCSTAILEPLEILEGALLLVLLEIQNTGNSTRPREAEIVSCLNSCPGCAKGGYVLQLSRAAIRPKQDKGVIAPSLNQLF